MNPDIPSRLIIDPEAAEVVRLIFSLALEGVGQTAIAKELTKRKIITPSVYKHQSGDTHFSKHSPVVDDTPYRWSTVTISSILRNPVYTGTLILLKTEKVNYKTKKYIKVPEERRVIIPDAHEAIISQEEFERVASIRAEHRNPSQIRRENLFRGLLYCNCCGHAMFISRKQLKYRVADIYLCTHHHKRPDLCPQTHIIYHEMLYPYVLEQIRNFAKSVSRRKIKSNLTQYTNIQELTPEILHEVIERIEVGHVNHKAKPGKVIQIYWKLG